MNIREVLYPEKWPALLCAEAWAIKKVLNENTVNIFHIGSTAVPGLMAKPIIDMMPTAMEKRLM